jgi:hypothetical protein
MSEGGEPKQDSQNQLRLPMSEGGEPKQDSQNQVRLPMSEGGEPNRIAKISYGYLCLREENLNRIAKSAKA